MSRDPPKSELKALDDFSKQDVESGDSASIELEKDVKARRRPTGFKVPPLPPLI